MSPYAWDAASDGGCSVPPARILKLTHTFLRAMLDAGEDGVEPQLRQ